MDESNKEENDLIIHVDLSLSKLKPLSTKGIVQMFQHITSNPDIVRNRFRQTGISDALEDFSIFC